MKNRKKKNNDVRDHVLSVILSFAQEYHIKRLVLVDDFGRVADAAALGTGYVASWGLEDR